ncbi:uncharacterized protein LOC129614179 [Condylostylus longicornis]|uniref:uncharacterized protein LOC129614179 n=1 Tax=Condylostylus longicornis TaxID=2530218 RepID=UPI00244DA8A8|nr:uncharacterized protein LOC129614179 [Condylostylus longicornis]
MSTRARVSARQKKIQEVKQESASKQELQEETSKVPAVVKENKKEELKSENKDESWSNNGVGEADGDGDTSMKENENDEDSQENDGENDVDKNETVENEEHEDDKAEVEEAKLTPEEAEKAKEFNKAVSESNIDEMSLDDILKLKIKLKDGSENYLFSRGPKYSEEKWPLNCHLCRLGNLFTEEHIRHHLKGRSHVNKLVNRLPIPKYYNEPFFTSVPKEFENDKPIKIFPGEVVEEINEENQDRVVKAEEFAAKEPTDEKLLRMLQKEHLHEYNSKLPLLGLCYIYKMMGFRGITYYCTLCNTKIEEEAFQHIVGSDHQLKYINRHFPKLYERVNNALKEIRGVDHRFCIRNIFRKFYRKIENVKGLRKITICDDEDFFKHKKRYLLKTRFDEHYGEDTIILTDQEIDVLIRKVRNEMQFIKPDLISLENPQLGYRMTFNDERAGEQIFDDMMGNRGSNYDNYGGGYDGGDVWDNYFQVLEREIEDLNRQYRNYDRFPRKHPKYEGEYSKYDQYKQGGSSDKKEFNMPWNTFWKRRLRGLYETDLSKRKQRIKRQLGLRFNARTPSPPPRRGGYSNYGLQGSYGGGGGGYGNNYGNQAAVAGLRELMSMMNNQQGGGGGGYGNNYNALGGNYNRGGLSDIPPPPAPPPSQQNEPLGVISVLRLFNALENQLGSLGPQAVQLLSRAVIVEKNGQNPNDLMMERDFYIFFVTAREKLKGQYIANTIPTQLMSAAKNTIQDCTTLIEMFEDFCKRSGKKLPDTSETNVQKSSNQWKSDQGGNSTTFDNDDFFIGGNTGAYASSNNNDNRGFNNNNASYGYSTGGYLTGGYSTGNNGGSGFNRNQSNSRWN